MAGNTTTNSSGSASSEEGSSASLVAPSSTSSAALDATIGDSCSWYADQSCAVPRSCGDCLDTVLASGDSCALDATLGLCVSASSVSSNSVSAFYFADSNSYCSVDDQACTACRAKWLSAYESVGYITGSAVCRGEGGCICLAACTNPQWATRILSDQCEVFGGVFARVVAGLGIAGCVCILLLLVCSCLHQWDGRLLLRRLFRCCFGSQSGSDDRADDVSGSRRRNPQLGEHQLALPAWKSMRERLIESEKRQESIPRLARAPSIARDQETMNEVV